MAPTGSHRRRENRWSDHKGVDQDHYMTLEALKPLFNALITSWSPSLSSSIALTLRVLAEKDFRGIRKGISCCARLLLVEKSRLCRFMKRKTSNSEQPSPSSELPKKKDRSSSNADESDPMATENRSNLTASQQDAERLAYEDRWSRLLHAVGAEALKRFQSGKILVSGLKGLGLEIGTFAHFVWVHSLIPSQRKMLSWWELVLLLSMILTKWKLRTLPRTWVMCFIWRLVLTHNFSSTWLKRTSATTERKLFVPSSLSLTLALISPS